MKFNQDYLQELGLVETALPVVLLNGKKICITGASGLIGSSVADLLLYLKTRKGIFVEIYLAGRDAVKIKERFSFWGEEYYRFLPYDGKFEWEISFDYLIHCAENAHPKVFSEQPVETVISAVNSLNGLLKYVRAYGGRVCYLSSSEVYGKTDVQYPITEDEFGYVDLSDARSCYPSSKRTAETLCACYKKEYGVDYVVVRPGHIYGPMFTREDSRVFAQFARNVLSGQNIVMKSAGSQVRSYCYALDCASAILTVSLLGKNGEAYNISNPDSIVSIRCLAETFASVANRKVEFELPSDAEAAGYNKMTYSALSSDKLCALGWKGLFDIKKGVESTLSLCEL